MGANLRDITIRRCVVAGFPDKNGTDQLAHRDRKRTDDAYRDDSDTGNVWYRNTFATKAGL